jgi:transposase InsO family protein
MLRAGVVRVGDITYVPTGEGWLYLAVLFDLCSRRVVGWAIERGPVRNTHFRIGDALSEPRSRARATGGT